MILPDDSTDNVNSNSFPNCLHNNVSEQVSSITAIRHLSLVNEIHIDSHNQKLIVTTKGYNTHLLTTQYICILTSTEHLNGRILLK